MALLVLVPVILAELYLRFAVGLGNPILYEKNHTYQYAPKPNQSKVRRRGSQVTIDENSLRTVEAWGDSVATNILFIGDSVTWGGTNVDDRRTFAFLTCVELEKANNGNYVCGNAGVNAYGIDNMTMRLHYQTDELEPDCVVATVISDDALRGLADLEQFHYYTNTPSGPFPALWEASGFALWRLLQIMTKGGEETTSPMSHQLDVARQTMNRLVDELSRLRNNGVGVLLVYSPVERELSGERTPVERAVLESMQDSKLPLRDLTDVMVMKSAENERLYFDGTHYLPAGHVAAAKVIAESLAEACPRP